MKHFIYLLLFLSYISSYSQDFRLINKADKIINSENPDLKKAKKYLARAKKADYGFCLNAKLSALSEIEYLNAKIYYINAEYSNCIELIDSGAANEKSNEADSLKVLCLIKLYGKSKIRDLILRQPDKIIQRGEDFKYKPICLDLNPINYTFCFYDQNEELNYRSELTILEIIKESNFYSILND